MLFLIALVVFCAYQNAKLAERKGQNTVLWAFITVVAVAIAFVFSSAALVLIMYKGPIEQSAINEFVKQHPFLPITVFFLGLGGYMVVRYILERMADKIE